MTDFETDLAKVRELLEKAREHRFLLDEDGACDVGALALKIIRDNPDHPWPDGLESETLRSSCPF